MSGSLEMLEYLKKQNEQLNEQVVDLREEMKRKDEQGEKAKERSDTIILQLTRQLENQQQLLEYHKEPWWKRFWRREMS